MNEPWIAEYERALTEQGLEVYAEGTPSVTVLYFKTEHNLVVGVDTETVCLYLPLDDDEMPIELVMVEHGGDMLTMIATAKIFNITRIVEDLRHTLV